MNPDFELLLRHLPVEITYIDADGIIRYISPKEEYLFPRDPETQTGVDVMKFHKPETREVIGRMLDDFRSGRKDAEYSWSERAGSFAHVSYIAIHDESGNYAGTMEVVQDIKGLKELKGKRKVAEGYK